MHFYYYKLATEVDELGHSDENIYDEIKIQSYQKKSLAVIFLQLIKPQKTTKKIYGIIKLIGNAIKSKLIFNGREIAFDRSGS